jgi:hypothetical protein
LRLAAGIAALLVALVVVSVVLAATYQPLGFGGSEGGQFPGLPIASGARYVNDFGGLVGDRYIPPQRSVFAILESIQNSGPRAVTIQAVSIVAPGSVGDWPLISSGQVLYIPEVYQFHERAWTSGRPVKGLSLGPNQSVLLGIPVRMVDACYEAAGTTGLTDFYVEERFLTFSHWVTIPFGAPVLMRSPEPARPSIPGLVCLK